jgi:hypothetical protein
MKILKFRPLAMSLHRARCGLHHHGALEAYNCDDLSGLPIGKWQAPHFLLWVPLGCGNCGLVILGNRVASEASRLYKINN